MKPSTVSRIATLDLIRGVAVLGILAINIAGFAGPPASVYSPFALGPASPIDAAVHGAELVIFEGKMRALFALLFGASMELFVTRAEDHGRDGQALQLRRLLWLALFGYLHFLLFWWGDILFSYAIAGIAALALRQMPGRALLATALLIFTGYQIDGVHDELRPALVEARVSAGTASPAEAQSVAAAEAETTNRARTDLAQVRQGFVPQLASKLTDHPFAPVRSAWFEFGEALPYMLIGGLLLRTGFFSGGWTARRLGWTAGAGIALGGAATVGFALWAWAHDFPFAAMHVALDYALGIPHLLMALGYAALLVLCASSMLSTWLGHRLQTAGRMAFSNYIGTTIVMTAIFYGWGLGLVGRVGSAAQVGFVLVGWALMLGASSWWLARFRQGPLEWLWRSLTEGRMLPLRLSATPPPTPRA